jgi:hypothetical protein
MKLLEMLSQTNDLIDTLDPLRDSGAFAEQLMQRRREVFSDLPGGGTGRRANAAAVAIAKHQIAIVKQMPALCRELGAVVSNPNTEAGQRLIIAAQLSYLVQPHDIIPDGLPGGFGYVDDAIFLRLALGDRDPDPLVIPFLGLCVPRESVGEMRTQMAEMGWLTNYMRMMPPFQIDSACRTLMGNPLVQIVPPGAVPQSAIAKAPNLHDGTLAEETLESITYLYEGGGGLQLKDGNLTAID